MKPYRIVALLSLALMAYSVTGCVVTETTTIAPDGTTTHTVVTHPVPGAAETASVIAGAVAIEVFADK
jgi:hypothetical protein